MLIVLGALDLFPRSVFIIFTPSILRHAPIHVQVKSLQKIIQLPCVALAELGKLLRVYGSRPTHLVPPLSGATTCFVFNFIIEHDPSSWSEEVVYESFTKLMVGSGEEAMKETRGVKMYRIINIVILPLYKCRYLDIPSAEVRLRCYPEHELRLIFLSIWPLCVLVLGRAALCSSTAYNFATHHD